MTDWQPIETAPKDGTAIWLWYDGAACIGYGEPASILEPETVWILKTGFRRHEGRVDDVYGCYAHHVHPTHWMPLPDPPKG